MIDDRPRLMEAANAAYGAFQLRDSFSAGSVGAALLTAEGNIYTGICCDLACGLGFCAEVAAVAEMLKARETHVAAVVAVAGGRILGAPCGRCRETLIQIDRRNLDCVVLMGEEREVLLRELLPEHWLMDQEAAEAHHG